MQYKEKIQNYTVDEISDSVEHGLFDKSQSKDRESVMAMTRSDTEVFQTEG